MFNYTFKIIQGKQDIANIPSGLDIYDCLLTQIKQLEVRHITPIASIDVIDELKNSKLSPILIDCLKNVKKEFLFKSIAHGLNHNLKVCIYSLFLSSRLNLDESSAKLAFYAGMYHDIGRTCDSEDSEHGKRSAEILPELNLNLSKEELNMLQTIITCHSLPDENFLNIAKLNKIENIELCTTLFKILKDADGLDRTRFSYPHVGISFMRYDISKQLIPFAHALAYNYHLVQQAIYQNIEFIEISREELYKLKNKYIFHGSPKLFDTCLPHQAHCDTKIESHLQFAVYGTSDLQFAICFSLAKGCGYAWEVFEKNGEYCAHIKSSVHLPKNKFGYLYCFEKSDFVISCNDSIQFYSKKELTPIKIYKIYYKDYKDIVLYDN